MSTVKSHYHLSSLTQQSLILSVFILLSLFFFGLTSPAKAGCDIIIKGHVAEDEVSVDADWRDVVSNSTYLEVDLDKSKVKTKGGTWKSLGALCEVPAIEIDGKNTHRLHMNSTSESAEVNGWQTNHFSAGCRMVFSCSAKRQYKLFIREYKLVGSGFGPVESGNSVIEYYPDQDLFTDETTIDFGDLKSIFE